MNARKLICFFILSMFISAVAPRATSHLIASETQNLHDSAAPAAQNTQSVANNNYVSQFLTGAIATIFTSYGIYTGNRPVHVIQQQDRENGSAVITLTTDPEMIKQKNDQLTEDRNKITHTIVNLQANGTPSDEEEAKHLCDNLDHSQFTFGQGNLTQANNNNNNDLNSSVSSDFSRKSDEVNNNQLENSVDFDQDSVLITYRGRLL